MGKQVLLVDDHQILRDGLRALLEGQMGHTIVGEADNGKTAVQLARALKPDVVIMDISMPDMTGIEAAKRILHDTPDVKIIALSMYNDKRFVVDMFRAGASGYLLKDCAFEELEEAIILVTTDGKYISPSITDVVLDDYLQKITNQTGASAAELSERERMVLVRMAEGHSTKQIAADLNVSTKTVDTYRQHIMDKLNVRTLADLIKYAIRKGLTSLDT